MILQSFKGRQNDRMVSSIIDNKSQKTKTPEAEN